MKNIILTPILLPTEDASPLELYDGILSFCHFDGVGLKHHIGENQHLYFTSDAPIKEGDWFFDGTNVRKNVHINIIEGYDKKIEFTTDPKLIADGVLVIDGNTKVIMPCIICKGNGCSSCDGLPYEVNFLTEFCKRWNEKDKYKLKRDELGCYTPPKDNQKVDVEKLADNYFKLPHSRLVNNQKKEYERELFIAGFNSCQTIQNAGGFSLEDMIAFTKESQPKGDIVIECETIIIAKSNMSTRGVGEEFSGYQERIKLDKDGQPILIFK